MATAVAQGTALPDIGDATGILDDIGSIALTPAPGLTSTLPGDLDLEGGFAYVRAEHLPTDAIGPGGLGTGAFYFAASGSSVTRISSEREREGGGNKRDVETEEIHER